MVSRESVKEIEKIEIDELWLNGTQLNLTQSEICGLLQDSVSSPGLFLFGEQIYILGGIDEKSV